MYRKDGRRRKEERGKENKASHFWRVIFDPSKWPAWRGSVTGHNWPAYPPDQCSHATLLELRSIVIVILIVIVTSRFFRAPTKSKSREPAYSQALNRLCLRLSPSVYLSYAHKTLHFYKTYILQTLHLFQKLPINPENS